MVLFPDLADVMQQNRQDASWLGGRFYKCPKCSRRYGSKTGLNQHLRLECGLEPQFQCKKCARKFHRKTSLKRHMLVHFDISYNAIGF